jgi:hypothetical protein
MKKSFNEYLGLAVIPLVAGFSANAGNSCNSLRAEWYSHYVRELNIEWETTDFNCSGQDVQVAGTFHDLESAKFDRVNHVVPAFFEIFETDVHHLKKQTDLGGSCDEGVLAVSKRGLDHTMLICPAFFTDDRVDQASTLAHESRHMEADDPGHVTCDQGPNKDRRGACDQNFTDGTRQGGGYNSDVNFLSSVVNAEVGNELSKSIAQAYINAYVPDSFNQITATQVKAFRKD